VEQQPACPVAAHGQEKQAAGDELALAESGDEPPPVQRDGGNEEARQRQQGEARARRPNTFTAVKTIEMAPWPFERGNIGSNYNIYI
jgi:hypothetical protein